MMRKINSSGIHPTEGAIANRIHLVRSEDIDALVERVHLAVQLVHELQVDPDLFFPACGLAREVGVGEFEISRSNLQTASLLGDLPYALLKCDLVILYSLGRLIKGFLIDSHQCLEGLDVHDVLLLELDARLEDVVEELLEELEDLLRGGAGSKVLSDFDQHASHRC